MPLQYSAAVYEAMVPAVPPAAAAPGVTAGGWAGTAVSGSRPCQAASAIGPCMETTDPVRAAIMLVSSISDEASPKSPLRRVDETSALSGDPVSAPPSLADRTSRPASRCHDSSSHRFIAVRQASQSA